MLREQRMNAWTQAPLSLAWAVGFSGLLALGAWARGSLSVDGALAACWVGTTIWMGLGSGGFFVLCTFFLTSSVLGRVGRRRKQTLESNYAKGHRRDMWQVLANGGVASACGAGLWWGPGGGEAAAIGLVTPIGLAGVASLASANADTWATELGVLASGLPRSILSGKRVPAGTSGAVSGPGLVVALGGSTLIALVSWWTHPGLPLLAVAVVAVSGFVGALLDSVLGATFQRQFTCPTCGEQVEVTSHCGTRTCVRGPAWAVLNNDAVNAVANGSAAALTWVCLFVTPRG